MSITKPMDMETGQQFGIGIRFWIRGQDGGHLFGHGRAQLLENIQKAGSISAGAAAMKMSYRQAWQMVTDMNKSARQPVVTVTTGGRGGGGAVVTAYGLQLLLIYKVLEDQINNAATQLLNEISAT